MLYLHMLILLLLIPNQLQLIFMVLLDEISYYLMHNHHDINILYHLYLIMVYLMVTNIINFPYFLYFMFLLIYIIYSMFIFIFNNMNHFFLNDLILIYIYQFNVIMLIL